MDTEASWETDRGGRGPLNSKKTALRIFLRRLIIESGGDGAEQMQKAQVIRGPPNLLICSPCQRVGGRRKPRGSACGGVN